MNCGKTSSVIGYISGVYAEEGEGQKMFFIKEKVDKNCPNWMKTTNPQV